MEILGVAPSQRTKPEPRRLEAWLHIGVIGHGIAPAGKVRREP